MDTAELTNQQKLTLLSTGCHLEDLPRVMAEFSLPSPLGKKKKKCAVSII